MKARKRIMGLFLAIALVIVLCTVTAYAEKTAVADTMRLEKTEGTVEICNSSGRTIGVREGGKLYGGYELTTEESYAWISLDESKLIKLDWNTQVVIKKTKGAYEIMLEYGKIFFDVDKPLEDDESLDIRTSTLSTGVRGTMGIVASQPKLSDGGTAPERFASVELLDGTVTVAFYSQTDGELKTAEIQAGELAALSSVQPGNDRIAYLPLSQLVITRRSIAEALKENPFALVEFIDNEERCNRIVESGALTRSELDELLEQAQKWLDESCTEAQKQKQEEQDAFDASRVDEPVTDPVFKTPAPASPEPSPQPSPAPELPGNHETPVSSPTPAPETSTPAPSPGTGNSGGETTPVPVPSYTVSFTYSDAVFATSEVQEGNTVPEPLLKPSKDGKWLLDGAEYDFGQPVKEDITLVWQVLP